MTTEAYRVGVTFALNNLVSAELAKIATMFSSTNKQAKELHGTLMTLSKVGVMAAGYAAYKVIGSSIDEARKFQNEVTRFAAMGFGDEATGQAVRFAKAMDVVGISSTQSMALIREASVVTGSYLTALKVAPELAKFQSGITAYMGGDEAEKASKMMLDLYKTAELRGHALDPAMLHDELDAAAKIYISTGGLVQPKDLFNFIKTGGVAAKGLSTEAFYFQEAHAMQETGGFRAGTSLMSAFQNLAMGRTTQAVVQQLEDMGLIDPSKFEMNEHTGKASKLKPGALKDAILLMNSQFDWFEKNIKPQLEGLSREDAIYKIASLASNRTAMNRMTAFYLEEANIGKAVALGHQASGIDKLYEKEYATYQQASNDASAKWSSLMVELGGSTLPAATAVLQLFSDVVGKITAVIKWFEAFKTGFSIVPTVMQALLGGGPSAVPSSQQGNSRPIVVQSVLDGRVIAESTTSYQIEGMAKAPSTGNNSDLRMTPIYGGMFAQ